MKKRVHILTAPDEKTYQGMAADLIYANELPIATLNPRDYTATTDEDDHTAELIGYIQCVRGNGVTCKVVEIDNQSKEDEIFQANERADANTFAGTITGEMVAIKNGNKTEIKMTFRTIIRQSERLKFEPHFYIEYVITPLLFGF